MRRIAKTSTDTLIREEEEYEESDVEDEEDSEADEEDEEAEAAPRKLTDRPEQCKYAI